jgi:hypothetical protein
MIAEDVRRRAMILVTAAVLGAVGCSRSDREDAPRAAVESPAAPAPAPPRSSRRRRPPP